MLQNLLRFVDTVELWQKANFHPDQPRVLAGNSDGGQWTDEGGGSDSGGLAHNVRQDVQSPLNPFKPLTVVLALHAAKAGRISEPAAVGRWPCGIQSPIYPGWGERLYQSSLDRSDLTEAATEMIRDILDRNEDKDLPARRPDLRVFQQKLADAGRTRSFIRYSVTRWDVTDPKSIRVMCEIIEHDAIPELRKILSFDDFASFASIEREPFGNDFGSNSFYNMLIAVVKGHFVKAWARWDETSRLANT